MLREHKIKSTQWEKANNKLIYLASSIKSYLQSIEEELNSSNIFIDFEWEEGDNSFDYGWNTESICTVNMNRNVWPISIYYKSKNNKNYTLAEIFFTPSNGGMYRMSANNNEESLQPYEGCSFEEFKEDFEITLDEFSSRFVKGCLKESKNILKEGVVSGEELEMLETTPTMKVYRSMQYIDGKLLPPMAAKIGGDLVSSSEFGVWEKAEEHPELMKGNKFALNKGNGKSIDARYNPYFHCAEDMLNDQFASAKDRPNLVVVECEIPTFELTSGYKAEGAKDAVGKQNWKCGVVQCQFKSHRTIYLSRYVKPIRIVPVEEVANNIIREIGNRHIVLPTNTFTPDVREALEERGMEFVETSTRGVILEGEYEGMSYSEIYGGKKSLEESTETLNQFKVLYHGSHNGELQKNETHKYNCLYLTPNFAYAAMYSCDSDNSHGCVFEMKPIRPLNIFDANDEGALDQLKAKVKELNPTNTLVRSIKWEDLKTKDWSTVCFRKDAIRDDLLLKAVKALGYDGYINHEWDDFVASGYANGEAGCGLIQNSISIGIFDENLLDITDTKYYDDYFEDEKFDECYRADKNYFIDGLQDGWWGDNEEAEKYAAENLLFLEADEVSDLIEDYME